MAIEKLKQQQHVQQSKRVKRTVGYGDDAIVVFFYEEVQEDEN